MNALQLLQCAIRDRVRGRIDEKDDALDITLCAVSLNRQEMEFARLILQGKPVPEAAIRTNLSEEEAAVLIAKQEFVEYAAAMVTAQAAKNSLSVSALVDRLNRISIAALVNGDYPSSIRATNSLARLLGYNDGTKDDDEDGDLSKTFVVGTGYHAKISETEALAKELSIINRHTRKAGATKK